MLGEGGNGCSKTANVNSHQATHYFNDLRKNLFVKFIHSSEKKSEFQQSMQYKISEFSNVDIWSQLIY